MSQSPAVWRCPPFAWLGRRPWQWEIVRVARGHFLLFFKSISILPGERHGTNFTIESNQSVFPIVPVADKVATESRLGSKRVAG